MTGGQCCGQRSRRSGPMPQEPRCDADAPWPVIIFGETGGEWPSTHGGRPLHRHTGGTTRTMSVTLINIFEVPAGDENAFIVAWEKTREYLKTFPAHIETALHQSLHDDRFRFVNIAHWR